jgi:hypothetical protein
LVAIALAAVQRSCASIMTRYGEVLDGAHRIAKAYLGGQLVISAVVIDDWPAPDGAIA